MSDPSLSRPQQELLRQLVFRWPDPCYLVITGRGMHALVVTSMLGSRTLHRMSRSFMRATTVNLCNAGLITMVEQFGSIPPYDYRDASDTSHGWRVMVTSAGREAIGAPTEFAQRQAQAVAPDGVAR